MVDAPIPDADEADVHEQAAAVVDRPEASRPSIPLDASEADAIEQSLEVPVDDEERA